MSTARSRSSHPSRWPLVAVVASVAVLSGVALVAGPGAAVPVAVPESPRFDAEAAFALLVRQVDFGPRAPGLPGHGQQLAWMASYLEERADTVVTQRFRHTGPEGERLVLTNLFARFRPETTDRVLLVAHWDTRPTADRERHPVLRSRPIPGANDGASGTAVLLQIADILAREAPPIGVDLLLVDGEDYAPGHMYLGAKHFARHLPPGYAPRYGVLVDMVADRRPRYPEEGYSRRYAPDVVDRVWRTAARIGYGHYFPRSSRSAISDDHVPLNDAGIPTALIIDFDYDHWHRLSDDLDAVSSEGLGVVGSVLTALIYSDQG